MSFRMENRVLKKYNDESNSNEVIIPRDVSEIGGFAFWRCNGITSVTIPSSIEKVGAAAFSGCTKLNSVILERGKLAEVASSMFAGCSMLSEITIPENIVLIGVEAFAGCSNLKSVVLQGEKINILQDAFFDCSQVSIIAPRVPLSSQYSSDKMLFFRGFLHNKNLYGEEQRRNYMQWAYRQRKSILPSVFAEDNVAVITLFAEEGKITKDNFQTDFLTPAVEANAIQCISYPYL